MAYRIAVVPGDGIGPEIVAAAQRVVEAAGVPVSWVQVEAGEEVFRKSGVTVPEETVAAVKECGVALKGPMANPVGKGYASPNIALRMALGLFVNVRLARAFRGARTHFPGMDVAVIREITEDLYLGAQQKLGEDAAIGIKMVTRKATERAAEFAFQWAKRNGRRRITVAHKAATLKLTDGLFLDSAQSVAKRHPDITCDDSLVDALAMHLVRDPLPFDILLGGFQYGDILSDLCTGLAGGLGLGPGASFGDSTAIFEPVHGSAPKYAGRNIVNPTGMILSAALMLQHLGESQAAARIWTAVEGVIAEGRSVTYDLGGSTGTREMATAVVARLTEAA
jgi:isocitrate dehydrogenase (NAD+)